MGLCFAMIGGAIVVLGYLALNFRVIVSSAMVAWLFLGSLMPVFLRNMATAILISIIGVILAGFMYWKAFRQINSEEAMEFYNDYGWFNRDFTFRGIDLRGVVVALLIIFTMFFNSIVPKSIKHDYEVKQFKAATKALEQELEKDPVFQAKMAQQQKNLEAEQQRKKDSKTSVAAIHFTRDSRKIWFAINDKCLFLADLASYKTKSFDFTFYSMGSENYLSYDGAYFFNPEARKITSTVDSSITDLKNRDWIVLGFANPSQEIVVYDKKEGALERFNFVT